MEPNTSDNNNNRSTPNIAPVMPPDIHSSERGVGALIATIIIIVVLLIGALYFWQQKFKPSDASVEKAPAQGIREAGTAPQEAPANSSDELQDIESDLDGTQIEGTDTLESEIR